MVNVTFPQMGLFGRKAPAALPPDTDLPTWAGTSWDTPEWREFPAPSDVVVGESYHQPVLARITGSPRDEGYEVPINATLLRQPDNPHDENAIAVWLSRNDNADVPKFDDVDCQLGYIDRELAEDLAPLIDSATGRTGGGLAGVPGVVVGGWTDRPNFGVKLYLSAIAEQIELDEELLLDYSSPLFAGQEEIGDERDDEDEEDREGPGYVDGRHFTEHVENVKRLKAAGDYDAALSLLDRLIAANELEAAVDQLGVAPWYYEQTAIIYRKLGQKDKEIAVLERFEAQPHAPGASPPKLAERLAKLRAH